MDKDYVPAFILEERRSWFAANYETALALAAPLLQTGVNPMAALAQAWQLVSDFQRAGIAAAAVAVPYAGESDEDKSPP